MSEHSSCNGDTCSTTTTKILHDDYNNNNIYSNNKTNHKNGNLVNTIGCLANKSNSKAGYYIFDLLLYLN